MYRIFQNYFHGTLGSIPEISLKSMYNFRPRYMDTLASRKRKILRAFLQIPELPIFIRREIKRIIRRQITMVAGRKPASSAATPQNEFGIMHLIYFQKKVYEWKSQRWA